MSTIEQSQSPMPTILKTHLILDRSKLTTTFLKFSLETERLSSFLSPVPRSSMSPNVNARNWMLAQAIAVVFLVGVCSACPELPVNSPCYCLKTEGGRLLRCLGPASQEEITSALDSMSMTKGPWDLHLENLILQELPKTARSVSSLRLTKCYVNRLLTTSAMGQWPKLTELVFESVQFQKSPWKYLKGANELKSVTVNDVATTEGGTDDLRYIPSSVEYLDVRKTGTMKLKADSLSHLKRLLYIFLADMPLTEFPREALPQHMPQLHTFILGNTLISDLDADFFSGMPRLEILMLNGNRFTTLDSQLFMPLRGHLTHLVAERNPLQCDCNLLWLQTNFQAKRAIKVLATCYDDTTNEFNEVMQLDENEYC